MIDHISVAIKTKRRYNDEAVSAFLDTGYFTRSRIAIAWDDTLDNEANHKRAALALCAHLHLKGNWIGAQTPGKSGNYVFVNTDSLCGFQS